MSDEIKRAPIEHPPIYTPYPNPHLADFVREHSAPYDEATDTYDVAPFARDISEGKNDPIYNAHSYHTKVPPKAIEPFILHYTKPGDLVLDPFCGSGMTGVAALRNGRKCILIDLSPAATFIAYNYCTPVDAKEFDAAAKQVLDAVKDELDWLYETRCRKCSGKATVENVVWSDVFRHSCGVEFTLWSAAVDVESGKVSDDFACPQCHSETRKTKLDRVGAKPVRVQYSCPKCDKRREDDIYPFDLKRIEEIEQAWTHKGNIACPRAHIPKGDKTKEFFRLGIMRAHQVYTTRNLWALARIWNEILEIRNERIRDELMCSHLSMQVNLSKMNRFRRVSFPYNPMSGTIYISSLTCEAHVGKGIRNKFDRVRKAFSSYVTSAEACISTQSATELSAIGDESVDYIFTDPPFGHNLMYSELNFLWEAWLGWFTDNKEEAIVNKTQGKGVKEYQDLMTASFREMYRVLKPNRYLTMVFHNSQKAIWDAIQAGLKEAGFENLGINVLDKEQRSFNAVTSEQAVGYDVLLTCYKPRKVTTTAALSWTNGDITIRKVEESLAALLSEFPLNEPDKRTTKYLYAKLVEPFHGTVPMNIEEVQALLDERFKRVDQSYYLWDQVPQSAEGRLIITAISSEHELVEFLSQFLKEPREWDDIHVEILKHLSPTNQIRREPREILEENFILDEESGKWRLPNPDEAQLLAQAKERRLIQEFQAFLREWQENGRLPKLPSQPALKTGMKRLYAERDYQTLAQLGEKIPEAALDAELKALIWAAKARA
jgi:DNA modification methylase